MLLETAVYRTSAALGTVFNSRGSAVEYLGCHCNRCRAGRHFCGPGTYQESAGAVSACTR